MAKELPYFKFEPGGWDNGKIQMCSFEAQGVFINVCSMYWQRLGDLPYKLALQRICKGNAVALQSLCDEGILKVIDGMICIDFLNEQLSEFDNQSKTNSHAAHERWRKHRENAAALQSQSERNAIREEESREDNRRVDERKEMHSADKSATQTVEDRSKVFMEKVALHLNGYSKEMLREFYDYWTEMNEGGRRMRFEMQKVFDIKKRLITWNKRNGNGTYKNGNGSTGVTEQGTRDRIAGYTND